MAKSVFYSFHYDRDVHRVQLVRNINALEGQPVLNAQEWEKVRQGGQASARILGTELWNTDATLSANAAMRGAWFASVSDTLFGQLATRYRERYGAAPSRLASLGYDAVLLTIRMSRDWRPGTQFPVNRLFVEDGFGGVDGIFRFDNRGIAVRALEVSEVRAGGFAVVDPAPTRW